MSLDKNYQGTDANLEISLEEYGFVARPVKVDYEDEYFVIYKMGDNQYGSGHIRESELDAIVNGTEWASKEDVDSMLETVGSSKEEWMDLPFESKFSDLVSYWGTENVIGTDYYPNDKKWAFEEIGLEFDSDDEFAKGGGVDITSLKKGDVITILGDSYKFLRYETENDEEKTVVLDLKDNSIVSMPKDMVEAYSKYKFAKGGGVDKELYEITLEDIFSFATQSKTTELTDAQYRSILEQKKNGDIVIDRYNQKQGIHEKLRIKSVTKKFAKGGGVRKRNGREYSYGRNWTNDHRHHNKSENYEIPMSNRKRKFADGGGVGSTELHSELIGVSISHATLKTEHLISAFMDFLNSQKPNLNSEIVNRINKIQSEINTLEIDEYGDYVGESEEIAVYIVNEDIFDLMNDIAPDGTYFGTTEGDGSDFGFWLIEDEDYDDDFAMGGGVRKVNGREYSYGRNWTNDHRHHNKSENYEIPMSNRKRKFADGGLSRDEAINKKFGIPNWDGAGVDGWYKSLIEVYANDSKKFLNKLKKKKNVDNDDVVELANLIGQDLTDGGNDFVDEDDFEWSDDSAMEVCYAVAEKWLKASDIKVIYEDGGDVFAKGGGVRKSLFGNREYSYGRNWTNDHRHHNKSENYEVPMSKRKRKYAEGGDVFAKGGGIKGIEKKAEKLIEQSINYRWVNTDMGSGWSFELESPLNRSVFNIIEEHTYLDEFSPEDAGFEDWDNESKEQQEYYYEEWKEEFYQGAFENFKEKCMKHLDDFIEYIQQAKEYQDEMNEYAKGGGVRTSLFSNREYSYGRNWTNEHRHQNKSENYEVPMSKRKRKYAEGGDTGYSKKDRVIDYYYDEDVFDDYETYGLSEDDLNDKNKVVSAIIEYHGLDNSENVDERFENLFGDEDEDEDFAKGGGVRKVNGREYSYGRNWTNDHRHQNKREDYEVPMSKRKRKYAEGGDVNDENNLEELWKGYASAILFAEMDENEEPLDDNYSIDDFDEETVKSSKDLIRKFYFENKQAIEDSGLELFVIGNDIWYSRAGHGAGFFDHSLDQDVEDKLIKGAKLLGEYPTVETYDGKISVRGGRVFNDYAKGGGVRKVNGREYSYGRNWTNDHRHHNKRQNYEIPMSDRKRKYAEGGGVNEIKNYDNEDEVIEDALKYINNELNVNLNRDDFEKYMNFEDKVDFYKTKNNNPETFKKVQDVIEKVGKKLGDYFEEKDSLELEVRKDYFNVGSKMSVLMHIAHYTGRGNDRSTQNFLVFPKYPNKYNEVVGGLRFAEGGGVRTYNGREYSYGRNWTNDHRHHNKSEDYEVPMSDRKRKYADGGDVEQNLEVGNIVELSEIGWDNENYQDFFNGIDDVKLVVTNVYTSTSEHQGFDSGVGMALYSLERLDNGTEVPFDLYDYELEYVSQGETFAKGGGVRKKNGREYSYGRNWTNDHRHHNKRENYEVSMSNRKRKYADGGLAEMNEDTNLGYTLYHTYDTLKEAQDVVDKSRKESPEYNAIVTKSNNEERPYKVLMTTGLNMGKRVYADGGGVDDKKFFEVYDKKTNKTLLIKADSLESAKIYAEESIDFNDYEDGEKIDLFDWFWNYDYRHYLRDASAKQRSIVKQKFIEKGLKLDGSSPKHSYIVISTIKPSELKLFEKVGSDGIKFADGGGVDNFDWEELTYKQKLSLVRESGLKDVVANKSVGVLTSNELSKLKNSVRLNKETKTGKFAKGGMVEMLNNIKETNTISEKEIKLINRRLNAGKVDADTQELINYIWDNTPVLTEEQGKKGYDYLMNVWKSPTGKTRVNNPFGYREQEVLENYSNFELAGFYKNRNSYIPIYNVIGKDTAFQYYLDGVVNIIGADGGMFAKGGGVRKVNGREYSYGRNWTNDHRHQNKREDYEVPMSDRKRKYADGGGIE